MLVISKKLKRKHGIEFGIGSFGFLELKDIWIKNGEAMTVVRISRLLFILPIIILESG